MSPTMRKKLERNLQYHAATAEYYQGQLDAKKKKAEESGVGPGPAAHTRSSSAKPTASATPPKADPDELLATMHGEVAKQLQEILDKEPLTPAIVTAASKQPVHRNMSPDLKPTAGRFH